MAKIKADMAEVLVDEYKAHLEAYKGDPAKINAEFFRYMNAQFDDFTIISGAQMRGLLVQRGVYKATNPRTEAKKGGKKKADYVAELQELVNADLPSAVKMTIGDLQILIEALTP